MWFDLDDEGSIVFTTGAETLKGRSIRRDPRVCLCIDDERPPFSFVVVEGEVDISEDPVEMLVWATRIGGPYMGGANAEAYGRRNAVPGELLVRLRPSHVVAQAAHRRVTVASRRAGSTGPPAWHSAVAALGQELTIVSVNDSVQLLVLGSWVVSPL